MKSLFSALSSLVLLFILQACEPEFTPFEHEFGDCLILDFPDKQFASLCQDSSQIDTSKYCDKTIIEEVFRLSADDKFWLPFYCCEIMTRIKYIDKLDQQFSLFISNKHYHLIQSPFLGGNICTEQPNKKQSYCITTETATIQFDSRISSKADLAFTHPINRSGFSIHLSIALAQDETSPNQFLTGTTIAFTQRPQHSEEDTLSHIQGIINQGTLPEDQNAPDAEFHASIDLVDRTFSNVHAFTGKVDGSIQKMYYNMDLGLVGFIDEAGRTWRLSDEFE